MSKSTSSGYAHDHSWLFWPDEVESHREAALGDTTCGGVELHVSETHSPQLVKQRTLPMVCVEGALQNELAGRHCQQLWDSSDLYDLRSLTPSDEELNERHFQSKATGYVRKSDDPHMPTLSKPLAASANYSKDGASSARTHLPSGNFDEARSLGGKFKVLRHTSYLHTTSDPPHDRKSQQSRDLLQLSGYSSGEDEPPKSQMKRQRPQVQNDPRKSTSAAKFKSSEIVESDSTSEVEILTPINRCTPSTGSHKKTPQKEVSKSLKGTHNGSSSVSRDTECGVGGPAKQKNFTVMVNKQCGKAMKRRGLSPPAARVHAKRPKLLGGFLDSDSESGSSDEFDASKESGIGDDCEEEPASDLEITVERKSKAASPPPKQQPLEIRRPALNPAPKLPQKAVSFSRLQELISKKNAIAAGRSTPPKTPSDQTRTAMVITTNSKQVQATLRGAQSLGSMTSHSPKRSVPSADKAMSDRSAFDEPKLQPAKRNARSAIHGDLSQTVETPPRPANVKPGLNTLNAVKTIRSASQLAINGNQSVTKPVLVLSPTKKPGSTTNRLSVLSSTAAATHSTRGSKSAIQLQGSTGLTRNADVVGDPIEGIRQGERPHNPATPKTSTSTSAQAKNAGNDGQMRDRPQGVKLNPQSQTLHQNQSGSLISSYKPVESPSAPKNGDNDPLKAGIMPTIKQSGSADLSRKQKAFAHQSPVAPPSGVMSTMKSKGKPTSTKTPEPLPASQMSTLHSLNVPKVPGLQVSNSVSSAQKRKAGEMTSGTSIDKPLVKKPATRLKESIKGAPTSTEASGPVGFGNFSLTRKSTVAPTPNASAIEKKAAASVLTSTTKRKPQIPAPTISGQKKAPISFATADQETSVQRQTHRNMSKELAPDGGPAIFTAPSAATNPTQPKEISAAIRTQPAQSDASAMRNPSLCVGISSKRSSPVVQGPKSVTVAQAQDAVQQQVSNQVQKEKRALARGFGKSPSVHTSSGRSVKPTDLPKATAKLSSTTIPAIQPISKSTHAGTDSPESAVSSQKPHVMASRRESTPVVISSTSSTLAPGAEPHFEYSIFQKIWSDPEDESATAATELIPLHRTNIEEANLQVERLFNDTLRQYQEHFQVHLFERTIQMDEHGCNVLRGTFSRIDSLHKKSHMKLWVQRDLVSAYAGRGGKDLKHTSFIAKTVYVLRLFKLVPPTIGSDTDGADGAVESTRVYHPVPCTECYTTADSANRAAKNLQIELSHTKKPTNLDKIWQVQNLQQLNKRVRDLAEAKEGEGRYWKSEFNAAGLGSATFELLVEKVGLCGPRNL